MEEAGEIVETRIERVVPGGDGLARIGGRVVLVAGALPGDLVRIRTEAEGARLLRGRLQGILSAGAARRPVAEVCPRAVDGSCGGCDWPAVRLEAHQELKKELVLDALRRVGRLSASSLPLPRWVGSPRSYRLRNRLHVDGLGRVGFYAPESHDVSELASCEIVSPALLARLPAVRDALRRLGPYEGELTTLEGRDGTPLLAELRPSRPVPEPQALAHGLLGPLDGIRLLSPEGSLAATAGPAALTLRAGGGSYRVSVSSFFQGNRYLLDAFLEEVRAALREVSSRGRLRSALDLYAGVGFLTRPLAEAGAETTAVEVDPSSSRDLAANAEAWKGQGLRVHAVEATAERFLGRGGERFDLILADPPRAGLAPAVRAAVLARKPRHLLMVSCDPATLARDLGSLAGAYRIESLVLLDLFPGTHHVETLVRLERRDGGDA